MKHARLISALAKVGIIAVQQLDHKGKPTNNWYARSITKGVYIEWHTQEGYNSKTDEHEPEKPVAICVCTPSPHTDAQRDVFCDRFYHSIKEVIQTIGIIY